MCVVCSVSLRLTLDDKTVHKILNSRRSKRKSKRSFFFFSLLYNVVNKNNS